MISLKDRLLLHDGFVDNEYLDKYVCLIERNRRTARTPSVTNQHHIVPRSWYRIHNIDVDDSLSNLVNLRYREHVLAHYFLCLCTTDALMYANELAFFLLINRKKLNLSEKLLVSDLPLYKNIYADYMDKRKNKYQLY